MRCLCSKKNLNPPLSNMNKPIERCRQSHILSIMTKKPFKLTIGLTLLICGCIIYISWRSEQINLYLWGEKIGLGEPIYLLRSNLGQTNPGTFVKNSLPDGLYCAAYILIMDCIWENENKLRIFMTSIVPVIAITHEILQYFNLMSGTFDIADVICYCIPSITYLIAFYLLNKRDTAKD